MSKIETFEVTEKFSFDSAHRIANGYPNRNIHGHSYTGEITLIYSGLKKHNKLNRFDFLINPSILKEFTDEVELELNNSILLYYKDDKTIKFCQENQFDYIAFLGNPTNEIIAKHIYVLAENKFNRTFKEENSINFITIKSVTINQTCCAKCVYYKIITK